MRIFNCLFIIIISILAGCATKVVSIYNQDVANINPKTFGVFAAEDYASLSEANKKLAGQLKSIISKGLELKGLRGSALPDLYVSYLINVHTSSETQRDNYNPYNRYNYNSYYNYSTRNYKEGVLIIDVKNDDQKLVWQGSKTFKVSSKQSISELLPEICREVIAVYTIGLSNNYK